jgi:hypothetical protein
MTTTQKPMEGTWTLTAPDGRAWQAESPLRVVAKESRERVPATVALERILSAADETREEEVRDMVNRFLGWPLPKTFRPDNGISFAPSPHPHGWPIGTNLFTASEARQMVEHLLGVKEVPDA